jgi:Flp pilus assembly protein TadB
MKTKKTTTQRFCQHWVHQTQDRDKQTKTQYRDTVNIGYTRHRTKTNKQKNTTQRYCQHWVHQTQDKDKQKHNTEILSTLGTPDTEQRQTNKKTKQRYCQHWVHQTQDRDKKKKKKKKDTVKIRYTRLVYLCPVSGVPNVDSISVLCFLFVFLCPGSGVPNVDSFSVLCFCLFVFVLFLVYPMLTVSLCCVFVCLSLSCVWCTQC